MTLRSYGNEQRPCCNSFVLKLTDHRHHHGTEQQQGPSRDTSHCFLHHHLKSSVFPVIESFCSHVLQTANFLLVTRCELKTAAEWLRNITPASTQFTMRCHCADIDDYNDKTNGKLYRLSARRRRHLRVILNRQSRNCNAQGVRAQMPA